MPPNFLCRWQPPRNSCDRWVQLCARPKKSSNGLLLKRLLLGPRSASPTRRCVAPIAVADAAYLLVACPATCRLPCQSSHLAYTCGDLVAAIGGTRGCWAGWGNKVQGNGWTSSSRCVLSHCCAGGRVYCQHGDARCGQARGQPHHQERSPRLG